MNEKSNIVVKGSLNILGEEDSPVVIKANSAYKVEKWGGIIFDNAKSESSLQNLEIYDATKGDDNEFPGAISSINTNLRLRNVKIENAKKPFYSEYGDIYIDSCTFISSNTIDFVNVKYAKSAIVKNCNFKGNNGEDTDAIDFDGVEYGMIKNNKIHDFTGSNSDGIDLGEACKNIYIENNYIRNINDKGISIGQGSKAFISKNVIIACSQGIGIKDFNSYGEVDKCTFYKNEYSVACFEKNVGAGGAKIKINNSILASSSLPIFVDEKSEAYITYSLSDTKPIVGTGNLNKNPLFLDKNQLNLELKSNSPCIDFGDPNTPKDLDGTRADMGAYYHFQGINSEYSIVIDEINYHSPDGISDSGDWVELYNFADSPVNISNWVFMDEKNSHKFILPDGAILESNGYIVISNDLNKFKSVYGDNISIYGDFSFGLGNGGDIIRLYDSNFKEVDIVKYKDVGAWSKFADGNGGSLLLLDPNKDNSKASSWFNKFGFPSPGKDNNKVIVDFDIAVINNCSGRYEYINKSSGPIEGFTWNINNNIFKNKVKIAYKFGGKGDYIVTLELLSNSIRYKNDKNTKVSIFVKNPIVEDGFSCGTGKVNLTVQNNNKAYWYDDKYTESYLYRGKTFETPVLNASKIYYVANGISSKCTSDRISVKAEVLDTVVANFTYNIYDNKVVFENESLNALKSTWDFGDGTIKNTQDKIVDHIYNSIDNYKVELITEGFEGKCKDSLSTDISIQSLSIDEDEVGDLTIYPNPSNGIINIKIPEIGYCMLIITNMEGQVFYDKIINKGISETQIDLRGLPIGTYNLKVYPKDEKNRMIFGRKIVLTRK